MKQCSIYKVSYILLACTALLEVTTYFPIISKNLFTPAVSNENKVVFEEVYNNDKKEVLGRGVGHSGGEAVVKGEQAQAEAYNYDGGDENDEEEDEEKNEEKDEEEEEEQQKQEENTETIPVHPIDEYITTQTTQGSSLHNLLTHLKEQALPEAHVDEISTDEDIDTETQRCARYGYEYNPSITKRRRIFMGSLIADDSWHTIAAHAVEAYGLYHTVAFIESNTTQTKTPRETRFDKGSLNYRMLQSGIFGPKTDVYVDFRVDAAKDFPDVPPIMRENIQREHITKRWKAAGMQPDDIGIIGDVDEVYTRDFLLALQSCDVPQFRPGQDCFRPQVTGQGLFFEGTPECQFSRTFYFHRPNAIIGECVDRIGDISVHTPGLRKMRTHFVGGHILGSRNFDKDPNRTMYPLWQPWDFRNSPPNENLVLHDGRLHTAYHFHNFFDSFDTFRKKYKTFGHMVENADTMPLAQVNSNIKDTILCLKEMNGNHGSFEEIEGGRPLLFQNGEYRNARQREMREELEADERKFGKNFDEPSI